jgi:hypothetical protein
VPRPSAETAAGWAHDLRDSLFYLKLIFENQISYSKSHFDGAFKYKKWGEGHKQCGSWAKFGPPTSWRPTPNTGPVKLEVKGNIKGADTE